VRDCVECKSAVVIRVAEMAGIRAVQWKMFKRPVWIGARSNKLIRCPRCREWYQLKGAVYHRIHRETAS